MVKITTFVMGLFAMLLFSVSFAAATTSSVFTITDLSVATSVNENAGTYEFTFNLTYTGPSTSMDISFADSTTSLGTLTIPTQTGMDGTASESRIVTGKLSNFANQGGNTANIVVNASTTSGSFNDETTFSVNINDVSLGSLCEFGEVGDLEISDFTIDNYGTGDDEEWEPLDRIEIEVEIANTDNDDSISDVMVEVYVFDENDNDVTNDFDFDQEDEDLGRIRDDDEEFATFIIDEVPADIDEGRYRIYIKAYSDGDEDLHCVSQSDEFNEDEYHEIEFVRDEDYAVIVKDVDIEPVRAVCGEQDVLVSFPVYNIGQDKEEAVLVNLYNAELGIDKYEVIENLRSGKKSEVSFLLDIPEEVSRDLYKLDVFTYFEYDRDEKDKTSEFSYDSNSYDDLDDDYQISLEIVGCQAPAPRVNALLDSAAKVGEELVIRTTITNTGGPNDFGVTVTGLEGWANLVSVTPQTLSLAEGGSGEVAVRLNPTAGGFHTFSITTFVDGQSYNQPVSVNIGEDAKNGGLFTGNAIAGLSNTTLYYTAGILILLILVFIVVIARLARRPAAKEQF